MTNIKVYKLNLPDIADNYQVFINDDAWSMSADANMPNGVCMSSDMPEREFKATFHGKYSEPRMVPVGVFKQAVYLASVYN